MVDALFERRLTLRDLAGPKDREVVGKADYAQPGAKSFWRLCLNTVLEQYVHNQTPLSEQLQKLADGRLIKRPSGLKTDYFDADLQSTATLASRQALEIAGHGMLFPQGVQDLQAHPAELTADNDRQLNENIDKLVQRLVDVSAGDNLSKAGDNVVRHHMRAGHFQCGGSDGDIRTTLLEFGNYANKLVRMPDEAAQKIIPIIDLRDDYVLSLDPYARDSGKVLLRAFTRKEYRAMLAERGVTIVTSYHCVDEQFPWDNLALNLAEKAAAYQNTDPRAQQILVTKTHNREIEKPHHVAFLLIADSTNPNDRKLAAFLTGATQMVARYPYAWPYNRYQGATSLAELEYWQNASATLTVLDTPQNARGYLWKIHGLYAALGTGLPDWRKGRLAREGSYAYQNISGLAIGISKSLSETTLIRPHSLRQKDRPRGPLVIVTESVANRGEYGLAQLKAILTTSFVSGIAVVDSTLGQARFVYDGEREGKPVRNRQSTLTSRLDLVSSPLPPTLALNREYFPDSEK